MKADTLQYFSENDIYLAAGAVTIKQGLMRVTGDSLSLEAETGEATVFGNVHFFDGENTIEAKKIVFNLNTKLGMLYKGKLFLKADNYHITGEQISKDGVNHYTLEDASFTTCDCENNPAWRFRVDALDLTLDKYLFAKNVLFYVRDIPVLYLPYFVAPIKRERSTGLLIPHAGFSTRDGFKYRQELFWAISKSQDATLSYEHRGKRGDGLGLEYRYVLSKTARGTLNTQFFRDKITSVDRWDLSYVHEQQFSKSIKGKLDVQYISENDTFSQLSNQTIDRARQNVESNLSVTYQGENTFVYLLGRYTQDLIAENNSDTPQRLPEIGASLIEYRLGDGPFFLNVDSSAVNFWSEGGLDLQRVDLYPKLALPLHIATGTTLTPWVGFRETWYNKGAISDASISRAIFPTGLSLAGSYRTNWAGITHRIYPEIFYEKITVREDGDIRKIDELDGLHDRETLTATIGQRFATQNIDGKQAEKASLRLTATLHTNDIPKEALNKRRLSDLRTEFRLQLWSPISLKVDTFYDTYEDRFNTINIDLDLKIQKHVNFTVTQRTSRTGALPKKGDLFNPYYLGDREILSSNINFWSEQLTITTPWGIRFVNKVFYDADQKELVEIDYILEYQAQCWSLGLSYIEFPDREEFSFLLTLRGLGAITPQK